MTDIELTPCDLICFSHKAYEFFKKQGATRYIVGMRFLGKEQIEYGILEVHRDSMGMATCTLNGNLMYQYGEKVHIVGYHPINIISHETNEVHNKVS